jgi:hypothetical protein
MISYWHQLLGEYAYLWIPVGVAHNDMGGPGEVDA